MPIRFIITFELNPGTREAFIEAARPCISATRRERGCLAYDVLTSVTDPDTVMLVEGFENHAALDAHVVLPHVKTFIEATRLMILSSHADPLPSGPAD